MWTVSTADGPTKRRAVVSAHRGPAFLASSSSIDGSIVPHARVVRSIPLGCLERVNVMVMSEISTPAIPPPASAPRSFEDLASSWSSGGARPRFLCADWKGRGRSSELDRRGASCDSGGEATPRQSWRKERRVAKPWRCACERGGPTPPRNRSGTVPRDERAATRRPRRGLQSAWSDATKRVRRNWPVAEIRAG